MTWQILSNFVVNWVTFYYTIWSHCHRTKITTTINVNQAKKFIRNVKRQKVKVSRVDKIKINKRDFEQTNNGVVYHKHS